MKTEKTYAVIEAGDDGIPFQCSLHKNQGDAIAFALEVLNEYSYCIETLEERQSVANELVERGYINLGERIVTVILCDSYIFQE
jgi:hypothetical protein